jgi:hypothetical protein
MLASSQKLTSLGRDPIDSPINKDIALFTFSISAELPMTGQCIAEQISAATPRITPLPITWREEDEIQP